MVKTRKKGTKNTPTDKKRREKNMIVTQQFLMQNGTERQWQEEDNSLHID
jgi:hypothetical protein